MNGTSIIKKIFFSTHFVKTSSQNRYRDIEFLKGPTLVPITNLLLSPGEEGLWTGRCGKSYQSTSQTVYLSWWVVLLLPG